MRLGMVGAENDPLSRRIGLTVRCRGDVGLVSWPETLPVRRVGAMNETRIVELRKARGWTQEKLAEKSSVTVRTIQRLEAGNDASLETLTLLARALQVPVRDLFADIQDATLDDAVTNLDRRTALQQERRRTITKGLESLYYGVGALLTLGVLAAIATDLWPNIALLIVPGYWVGGWLLSIFLLFVVVGPRLDRKYPLSIQRATE